MDLDDWLVGGRMAADKARKRYFLTTADMKGLDYTTPFWYGIGCGSPMKYYRPSDLKERAEQKYGKEGFAEKLKGWEKREKKRKLDEEKKRQDEQVRKSKKQKLMSTVPEWGRQKLTDLASVGALAQKCSIEQLQQVLMFAAEKKLPVIEAINAVKDEALLPRRNFKELQPKLAKFLDSDADAALKKNAQKLAKAEASKAQQAKLNRRITGAWDLTITNSQAKVNGLTGTLDISAQSGSGYIEFPCCYGNLDWFCETDCETKYIEISTWWKVNWKRTYGKLRLTVKKDKSGDDLVEGTYNAGWHQSGWPALLRFTGVRKGPCMDGTQGNDSDRAEDTDRDDEDTDDEV
ncbi:Hypp5200 [Branchiostoma lanceolatum]|uniref:Hypp5200 protein n=1 Tax=Branchiostoma lanceolatum TaxID=7740 RepID=A0A8K0AD82_BRALA|nr:Hypp5200 [Branchiostoma lanceolatum]